MEDKTTLGFVILITWWKMNKSRYPILSDIAKDIGCFGFYSHF